MTKLYIGLMSGTSIDGIDAVLVDFSEGNTRIVEHIFSPYSLTMRQQLLVAFTQVMSLSDKPQGLDQELGNQLADSALGLLKKAGVSASEIMAIGSHGQTLFHQPEGINPFSMQIGCPSIIADRTGAQVVANFRQADIDAGGQGAPLVPMFHQKAFQSSHEERVIVNIGGITNITVLPRSLALPVLGFDTGPGNLLMDGWIQQHKDKKYDFNGLWSRSGRIDEALLSRFLEDDFFAKPPPKSSGREHFNIGWLLSRLDRTEHLSAADIQATVCELTARSLVDSIASHYPQADNIMLCGGGAFNLFLKERISIRSHRVLEKPTQVSTSADCGLAPNHVEAVAFAWLAHLRLNDLPGNIPTVTGAKQPVLLGDLFYPSNVN